MRHIGLSGMDKHITAVVIYVRQIEGLTKAVAGGVEGEKDGLERLRIHI